MVSEFFQLKEKQTSVRIEFVAGVTTFLTMAYIIFVNPAILSDAGMDKEALIAVTCMVTALATLIVGVFANAPIAMAPGMGLNAFFAYLVVSGKMDWKTALGVVFLSGLLFLILTLLGLRKKIVEAIPPSLISAIAVGIGLFITFIGLVKLGVVVGDEHTLVKAGPITTTVLIGLLGLLIMLFFEMKKISGGLVVGILAATALAVIFDEKTTLPQKVITLHLNIKAVSFQLNVLGALKWSFFGSIFTLMFMDMFDSVGTLAACCHQANMVDENNKIKGLDRLLGIDAIATMIGALLGTSTTTS
ncbi:MAG TPA: NCS2 family permease, partial [Sedimentisphaerales bacterium]|nr:NCS2 family permease [Sedimentisphaerales bacterium]